ncbi:hypothetical protein K2173_016072 [Erythroxylum novogranatense]|uniref:AAA+ ATPase domain-containing protein n=1 Tax=Erythroxylum novogranatense TaxID=1862640 RepID=A0AAV8SF69_9ROSI|nr:hypothetical protein K2173_016072 [Erythroxylum novogranatense]
MSVDFITPLIAAATSLCEYITAKVSDVVNVDQRIESLESALAELKDKRDDLNGRVTAAEVQGLTCTSQVQGWFDRVEVTEREACSVVEDLGQKRRCFWQCNSSWKLSKKVKKLLIAVNELKGKSDFAVVCERSQPSVVQEISTRPAIGLNIIMEKVWQCLQEDACGVIGIYGMGGVGKTTLLKNINNEFLTKSHLYDIVIWVVVSKDFVADRIQQAVEARLGLSWEESESHEQRAQKIYGVMRRKKFVLLLDDVWEGIDLEKIGIPLPSKENKCKVIITTRSLDVCSNMDALQKLKVEFLGKEDSWKLFCDKVGQRDVVESWSIRPLAEAIVRKCGGLPLALITIGKAMANTETEEEWEYAEQELDRSPTEIQGMEDVYSLLKFSYDRLKDDTLKSCFLYCSLFPEDYSIEKEQLIEYWLGEGFLDRSTDRYVYNKGYALIGSLKVACLLEAGAEETQVKMHDVVRSFALWILSKCGFNKNLIVVEASKGLTEAPRAGKWKEAKKVSLLDNGITELEETPECPNLSTLLLQWNSGLSKISIGFFQFMPALRVLDLSFTSLREVPTSINKLVELRYLDLTGTKISTLPEELGDLSKLEHLDLQRISPLRRIPQKAISKLLQLKVLNLYYSYGGWEQQNYEGENEVGFKDLECLNNLTTVGITVNDLKILKRIYSFSSLLKRIQYLYIKESENLLYLRLESNSNFGVKLRRLSINNCYDLQYLQVNKEAGGKWLPSLEVLALHGLPNLMTVWKNPATQECLQNLRCINIWHCHKLKNISWILRLPKLELIYLMYCKELEGVVSNEQVVPVGDSRVFPSLKTLSMRDLPELISITPWAMAFPSLKSIAVIDCPKLKRLPLKVPEDSELPTVYGTKEWWDGLEWDEAITRSNSLPNFIST